MQKVIKMSNETYDALKEITTVWLPALGTLYFVLSGIWGLPLGEQVVGSITALVTFLGTILHISTKNYQAELEKEPEYDLEEMIADAEDDEDEEGEDDGITD